MTFQIIETCQQTAFICFYTFMHVFSSRLYSWERLFNLQAIKVTNASASYWEGKADAETLQRVYGISFPDPKQLKEWQRLQVPIHSIHFKAASVYIHM